jgi:Fe-S cluster assembly protein SufD
VVFVDGVRSEALSHVPAGLDVRVAPLTDAALAERAPALAGAFEGDWFAALNEAGWSEGALLEVGKDTSGGLVHVAFVSTGAGAAVATLPRLLVRAARGATIQLVEEHVGLGEVESFAAPLVEVVLGESARVDHVKIQREALTSHHVARLGVHLSEGAHYRSVTGHYGGAFSRQDVVARIDGGNTTCELHGLVAVSGRQVSDTHSSMDHRRANSRSDQLHKCVVGGKGHSIFNGKIFVRQDAQQINAFQLNRNLLTSAGGRADTKPQLEIFADDVKCSHGATIGQLDPDQLFYLQTRGVTPEAARGMLTYAFAAEVLERVPILSARAAMATWLAQAVR